MVLNIFFLNVNPFFFLGGRTNNEKLLQERVKRALDGWYAVDDSPHFCGTTRSCVLGLILWQASRGPPMMMPCSVS